MADGKIVVTLKAGNGYDAPWLVIGSDTTAEIQTIMEEAHAQDLFTAIGRAADALKRGVALGAGLGARTIEVTSVEEVPKAKAKAEAAARPAPEELVVAEEKPKVRPPLPAGAPKPAWAK